MPTSQPSRQAKKSSRYTWQDAIRQLRMYKEKKGHCNVPSTYSNNMQLARYVQNRRLNFRMEKEGLRVNHVLRKEEREALEELEFEFELANYTGKRRYYENQDLLIKYRNETGNCDVPTHYPEDQELADWCTELRTNRKLGKDRRKRLEDIGFNFGVTNISGGRRTEEVEGGHTNSSNADNSLCAQKENSNPNPSETAKPNGTITGGSARPSSLSSVTPASLSMASSKPTSRTSSKKKGSKDNTNKNSTSPTPTSAAGTRQSKRNRKPRETFCQV